MGRLFSRLGLIAGAFGLASLVPGLASAQTQTVRVQFAKGASAKTVKGSIRGDRAVDYILNARAGQTLTVKMTTSNASSYFNVTPQGADSAIFIGSTSGNSFTGKAPVSGDYRITVYLMRNAARRNEVANYTITIGASGRGQAMAPSYDAKVAGTPYNATAKLGCAMGDGKPMSQCDAGVIRSGGGNATIRITQPAGTERVINFRGGNAVSSNGEGPFSVRRIGDMSLVSVGRETYEVPDAFVVGG